MRRRLWSCYGTILTLTLQEDGQDLIEYAMLVALIALATTAGMHTAAGGVNAVFNTIGATIKNAVS
jgi:pilus assembly protein Flp/PilA